MLAINVETIISFTFSHQNNVYVYGFAMINCEISNKRYVQYVEMNFCVQGNYYVKLISLKELEKIGWDVGRIILWAILNYIRKPILSHSLPV